jgi:prephenate dehydratase
MDVAEAVVQGTIDAGVLPLKNNLVGEVTGIREIIERSKLQIVKGVELAVRHHLVALPRARIRGLTTVASHPMALKQCARSLKRLGLQQVEATSTAVAAKQLSDLHSAALASELAAQIYGLNILKPDLQDRADNRTAFVLVRSGQ